MSLIEFNSHPGDLTVFGFTADPDFLNQRLAPRLGITPRTIDLGSTGQIYYYSSYGDIAESEEAIVLKLGLLRSTSKSALNAQQLLEQKIVKPRSINIDAFSGNGLVVGLSKTEQSFSIFQTLMGVPQLYYSVSKDGILCSDRLSCVVSLMPHLEINEAVLPQHFLFRLVCGSSTYFRDVNHLMPGYLLKWVDGNLEVKLIRSLDAISDEAQFIRDDTRALNLLSESFDQVMSDYIAQTEGRGQELVNLLSGGVDSSFIQYSINANSTKRPLRSISYAIQVPAFEFEINNAREASELLKTEHTFVNTNPVDYPYLLTRTIDILSQPHCLETAPSFLAICEYVQAAKWPNRYFYSAMVADSVFGEREAVKLKGLKMIRNIPFAATWLRWLGKILAPVTERSQTLIKGAEIISSENDPDSYVSRANSFRVDEVDWDIARRSFGDQAIRNALAIRRNLVTQYSCSHHYLDEVHFIQLLTVANEISIQWHQLALAHNIEIVYPLIDEDILKAALTIHPEIRYIKGFKHKHLLKQLVAQKANAPVAYRGKGGSIANDDLVTWMHSGPLRPLVEEIQRPGFMTIDDFNSMIQTPKYSLMSLLTFDILNKRIIKNRKDTHF